MSGKSKIGNIGKCMGMLDGSIKQQTKKRIVKKIRRSKLCERGINMGEQMTKMRFNILQGQQSSLVKNPLFIAWKSLTVWWSVSKFTSQLSASNKQTYVMMLQPHLDTRCSKFSCLTQDKASHESVSGLFLQNIKAQDLIPATPPKTHLSTTSF